MVLAYSLEYHQIITADDAYDLYWADIISDQKLFQCPSENCQAQITCANMYKAESELKQRPHFRCKEHSRDCKYILEKNKNNIFSGNRSGHKDNPDHFILERPEIKIVKTERIFDKNTIFKKIKESNISSFYSCRNIYYSIRPIVTNYLIYKQEDNLMKKYIEINNSCIPYQFLFKWIYSQDVSKLNKYKYIYCGFAYINRLRDDSGYRIVYKSGFKFEEDIIKPSIIIPDDKLHKYPQKKRLEKILDKDTLTNGKSFFVSIYAEPKTNIKNGKKYINFILSNYDLIDLRSKYIEDYL